MKARKKKLCLSNNNILIFHSNIPMPNFSFSILYFAFYITGFTPPQKFSNIKTQRRLHYTIRDIFSER